MTATSVATSDVLVQERAVFEAMREDLEKHYNGKFVVLIGNELKGTFDSFNVAAQFARANFGRGPYLIRQVGAPTSMSMPASVAFRTVNANP